MKSLPVALGVAGVAGAALAVFALNGYGFRSSNASPVVIDRGDTPSPVVDVEATRAQPMVYDEFGPDPTAPAPEPRSYEQPPPEITVRVRPERRTLERRRIQRRAVTPNTNPAEAVIPEVVVAMPPSPRSPVEKPESASRPARRAEADPPVTWPGGKPMTREELIALRRQLERDREWRRKTFERWERENRERRRRNRERDRQAIEAEFDQDGRLKETPVSDLEPADEVDRAAREGR